MASLARPSLTSVSRADVLELSGRRGEPEWLRERRLHAFEVWERTPLPSKADEAWRRTDIARLALGSFEAKDVAVELSPLPGAAVTRGVVFTDLAAGLRSHEELLREHLLKTVTPEDGKFAALNAALFTSAALLYVPPGQSVELPLRAVQRHADAAGAIFPRTLVVAGRGSRVLLVDEGRSDAEGDAPGLSAAAVEVVVEDGAQVLHAQLNRYGRGVSHFLSHRARLGRDARYLDLVVATGSGLTKARIETLLEAPGAESHVLGVVYGDGTQHFDHDTLQDHRAPHTASRLLFKAALAGRARSVYTGLLRMHGAATQSDASQTNRNLLLSRQAKADSIPKLEIEVNDVKCSHASATSSVDPDQVFYLTSRGLAPGDAVHMLVEGFLDDVLAQFPLPELRDEVAADLASRLAGAGL